MSGAAAGWSLSNLKMKAMTHDRRSRRSFRAVNHPALKRGVVYRTRALEALAFKLMRLLDMTYVATRLRAQATGGARKWI
jgi:hypothetical protein